METTTLTDLVLRLSEALDPEHQGDCWPDPIAWDGRPLTEQAEDLLVLAETQIEQALPGQDTQAVAVAARAVRAAL